MLYPRNPDLDPQLVWRGKDELDAVPLRVPTVSIYIHEKVLPAALIRDLKRVSKGCEPQVDLFGGFDRISDSGMRCTWCEMIALWIGSDDSEAVALGQKACVGRALIDRNTTTGT